MDWMKEFIGIVLADVPAGRYRTRTEKELRDHLSALSRDLEQAGYSLEEAQRLALTKMGDPVRLGQRYQAEALRREAKKPVWYLKQLWNGCVLMGTMYILTALMLGWIGFTMDAVSFEPHTLTGRNFPILGGGPAPWIYYGTLFLVPYILGALWLRRRFQEERRPAVGVTLGLLAAWVGEKGICFLLSALIYGMPLGPELLERMAHGGDTTAPWFDVNMVLTFLGCLVLGQLFGRTAERRRELA